MTNQKTMNSKKSAFSIGVGISVIFLTMATFGYFLPFCIAYFRLKKDVFAIFTLNLLLGWTFIGWVIALVWAFKN